MSARPTTRLLAALLAAGAAATLLPASPAAASPTYISTISRVSVDSNEAQAVHDLGTWALLDGSGRYVVFDTDAPFAPGDTNDASDVYLRDRVAGTTTRISLTDADGQIGGYSAVCGFSRNARFVAFSSGGSGLPVPDATQLYLRDRTLGTTTLISTATDGTPAGPGLPEVPSINGADRCPISDDGRYVAFASSAGNLVPGDASPSQSDVFRRDRQTATTIRVSTSTGGAANNAYASGVAMSANGNVIGFTASATNLVPTDTNGTSDAFVRTVSSSTTVRANTKANGAQVFGGSGGVSLTADGTRVAFSTSDGSIVPGGSVSGSDIYVKTLATGAIIRASLNSEGNLLGGSAGGASLSDDGTVLAFSADRPDGADPNNEYDVYRKDLTTGALTTISTNPDGVVGNKFSDLPSVSGNGNAVAFRSGSTNLVRKDTNSSFDAFVRDTAVDLAPFVTTTALVKQQFTDFEGRAPTAAELTEWKARISNGERTPDQVIDDFAHGTTFAGKRAPMIRLYWAFFLRAPDQGGLDYWTTKLSGGTSLAKVAKQFATSSEFQTKYGSKTNSQFVTLIYQNIFKRNPDPAGLAYWTTKLDTKTKTRGDVMVNFSESSEGKRVLAPQTDTILHVLGMLRTMPSKLYLDLTLGAIKGPWISPVQVASLRGSGTYAARITP